MIRRITSILNESVTAMPVGDRVPFVEVIDGVPSVHAGGGQFVPVINDNTGGVSYWRSNGAQQVQQMDKLAACGDAVRISVPLALVAFVRREQCDAPDALLNSAAHQINASLRSIRDSIQGAFAVNASSMTLGIDLARTNEIKDFMVPSSLAVLTLAAVIHIDATPSCLEQCGDPYDLVCAVIDGASNAKVVGCLGPDRVAEICDIDPPEACPLTWTVRDGEGNVLASGVVADPCATPVLDVDVDCAAECAPLTATMSGVEIINETDPCGVDLVLSCSDLVDAIIVEGAGTEAANGLYVYIGPSTNPNTNGQYGQYGKIGSDYILESYDGDGPDGPWSWGIFRNDVTVIDMYSTGFFFPVPWDAGAVYVATSGDAPNPTVRQATIADLCPCATPDDSTIQRKDSAGDDIGTPITVPYNSTEFPVTCPDGSFQRKDSAGANIGGPIAVKSNESGVVATCPDGTVTIKNLGGTTLGSQAVKSNGAIDYIAPIPCKFVWNPGFADVSWTITADEAGAYNTYTPTGTNGTITFSNNGSGFAALSGAITLVAGQVLIVRRTITTSLGWTRWVP